MKQRLRQALSQRQKRYIVDASKVPSAVLLPIFYKEGQYFILFTKRTEKVREHKGQISFPGGVYQKGDRTLTETALRECEEEIGLMAKDIEILGELDDTVTQTSNYVISPFVALIPWPYRFKIDREEIEEIIEVPTVALLDAGYSVPKSKVIHGEAVTSDYHYQGRVIWGATARILKEFLDIFARVTGNR